MCLVKMPFVQRIVEPKFLSRTRLFSEDGSPLVKEDELITVTNNTLSNALRQLASLVLIANDIFTELGNQLQCVNKRSEDLKVKIKIVEDKVNQFDPKKVTVPESDICTYALQKEHYAVPQTLDTNLFTVQTRPVALQTLYESATKTPVHLMRQLDRWRRDGHRSSRFFLCTPVLGAKRRKIKNTVDIDIETHMPSAVEELRRWTSNEALGDITVSPSCTSKITNTTVVDGSTVDRSFSSTDEAIDHKLPSPEEQLQVMALKFPAEIVAVDISGKSFDRMSILRRSLMHGDISTAVEDKSTLKRRTKSRKPRSRRRNTLAGTDQKEIQNALSIGEETAEYKNENENTTGVVSRSKSSDLLRSNKKDSTDKKSHFNSLKQWSKNRYDRFINKSSESKEKKIENTEDVNLYETITSKRNKDIEKERRCHERNSSISSSEKSSITFPIAMPNVSTMTVDVKLRASSVQRRQRRSGEHKDEPHSSSGNWSASSESGRASIGSEITNTTHPKSTSVTTSNNSLNLQPPNSVNSRRRFNINSSTSGSATSEGTLTPDIIHDLHEDGETSSIYSCDTEGYYTSFHLDSGLKTLKEEELPCTPMHSTSAFSNSGSNNTVISAENEYELFGRGSTSTTTSSAGTVCTTLRASDSNKSLVIGPAVPERKSSLTKLKSSQNSEKEFGDKTGTIKRSPANHKPIVVALIHKQTDGDMSPDSGHNTSTSPIESINSPNGIRSSSEYEFSESSDVEGSERIERIREKTTINSSRIPSLCVITPPQSDDESVKSNTSFRNYNKTIEELNNFNQQVVGSKNDFRDKLELKLVPTYKESNEIKKSPKISIINVNPQSGYATVEMMDVINKNNIPDMSNKTRSPSPSGGTVTVMDNLDNKVEPTSQPSIKSTLMPLNSIFGKLKNNLVNLTNKSPNRNNDFEDAGEYVTIADVHNNNKAPIYGNDINKNINTILSGKVKDTEYVSLNELPFNESQTIESKILNPDDSLERRKRQGARVTLNAEGKVVYSSDSLSRRKAAQTTFEPGPFVKTVTNASESPLPIHRSAASIRPVQNTQQQRKANIPQTEFHRPLSPQLGKLVIKAASGTTLQSTEIVRMTPSTIVTPSSCPMSPKTSSQRGAYVYVQDSGRPLSPTQEKGKGQDTNTTKTQSQTKIPNTIQVKSTRVIKRSNSYKIANPVIDNIVKFKENAISDIDDITENEIATDLWREKINYPPSVSPKLCDRQCHIYSQAHAQKMLLASPSRIIIPTEHRVRVLTASAADTEIW